MHLNSEVLQIESQHVSGDSDSSLSLVVLSGAQPWFNVLHEE